MVMEQTKMSKNPHAANYVLFGDPERFFQLISLNITLKSDWNLMTSHFIIFGISNKSFDQTYILFGDDLFKINESNAKQRM